ncbi:metallophosphoesterase family protein [Bacillus sp. DJP31]|uniref:metallophosphoesterase family protein n=1 Tax=Bacillus sp. DJP31 TaxID=3409789 RepID=UPI003BB6AAE9
MRIVVLADTHMPKKAKVLPAELIQNLEESDQILHLGDWQSLDLFDELQKFAPVDGVAGNVDSEDVISRLGYQKILTFNDFRFGLVHGHQGKGPTTEDRARNTFRDEQLDAILFGHSHIPVLKERHNITLFNPGSPTDKRRQSHFSFGIIDLSTTTTICFQHIFF